MRQRFDLVAVDLNYERVRKRLLGIPDLSSKVGKALRESIDFVIDGRHTGRYRIEQLEKTEKTFIGTKVEQLLLYHLKLPKQPQGKMDTLIDGVDVDIKFTLGSGWMIPQEAIDQLCLVATVSEERSEFSLGLARAREEYFRGRHGNRDQKYTLSKNHHGIEWLIPKGSLPPNFLLHLPEETRHRILAKPIGQQRVNEFFRLCPGKIVDGVVVETLAAQRDSSKRVRDARLALKKEGLVICSNEPAYREIPPRNGLRYLVRGEFVSLPVVSDRSSHHTRDLT